MQYNFFFETNDLFHQRNMVHVLDNLRALRDIHSEGPQKMYGTNTNSVIFLGLFSSMGIARVLWIFLVLEKV